jgi:RNA-directed DNA polymerase
MVMNGIDDEILKANKTNFPIRFADDLTIFGNSKQEVEASKTEIEQFLALRGLTINEAKTKLVEISDSGGIDFLGYNIKEYKDETRVGRLRKPHKRGILLIKPSINAINTFQAKVKTALKTHRNGSALNLILKLNPIIRG